MRGGVRPNGGDYDPNPKGEGRNPRQWAVHPPSTSPDVFLYFTTRLIRK